MKELEVLDAQVEDLLTRYMGTDAKVAIDTYRLGLRMKEAALKDLEKPKSSSSKLKNFLESEVVLRVTLLILIPVLGALVKSPSVSGPLRRLCIR